MVISDIWSILAGPDVDHISWTHCTCASCRSLWTAMSPQPGPWSLSDLIVVYFIKKVVKEMVDDLADEIEYYFSV